MRNYLKKKKKIRDDFDAYIYQTHRKLLSILPSVHSKDEQSYKSNIKNLHGRQEKVG